MNKIQITVIGDSITQGVGVYGSEQWGRNAYPAILARMLQKDPRREMEFHVINRGMSGWSTARSSNCPYMEMEGGKVWNLCLEDHSDIYVIALGTNDSKYIHGDDDYKGNYTFVRNGEFCRDYRAMIEALYERNKAVRIYACLPVPCLQETQPDPFSKGTINECRLRGVRQEIRKAAEPFSRVTVVDLNQAYLDVIHGEILEEAKKRKYTHTCRWILTRGSAARLNELGTPNGKYLYDRNLGGPDRIRLRIDGIHPGLAGSRLIAETIYAALCRDLRI